MFANYTTATPPAAAFSPPPGVAPSPAPTNAPTPRQRYRDSPASQSIPLPKPRARESSVTGPASSLATGVRTATGQEDAVLEARRVIAQLNGVDGASGFLGDLEKSFEAIFSKWESPFDESLEAPDIKTVLTDLTKLLAVLRNSPVGGVAIPSSPIDPDVPPPPLDANPLTVQKLFKERQRAKEGAEIAGSVLSNPT